MADTIKLVEQPVGSGKTFHVIRKIVEADGLIIYCAPTKILARQVKKNIQKVITPSEFVHRKNTPLYIVTSEDKDYSTTVQEALTELIIVKLLLSVLLRVSRRLAGVLFQKQRMQQVQEAMRIQNSLVD